LELDKDKKQFVSIILPLYNGEKFIKPCITSILNQTHKNYEIIAVDDKSSDNTLNIINSLYDERIKVYKNETNIGLAQTLNRAIGLSAGSILVRIDQDDIMEKDRLRILIREFLKNNQTELIFSRASVIDTAGKKIGALPYSRSRRNILFTSVFLNIFTHSTAAFTKSSILKIGGYPITKNRDLPEDFATWSEYLKITPSTVVFLREKLVQYRINPYGLSSQNKRLNASASYVCESNLNFYIESEFESDVIRYIARRLYNLNTKFKLIYFYDVFRLLLRLNTLINNKSKINDVTHIFYMYGRIFVPVKIKFVALGFKKVVNKIKYSPLSN